MYQLAEFDSAANKYSAVSSASDTRVYTRYLL